MTELLSNLDLPLAQGDLAAAVVQARVQSHDTGDCLSTLEFDGGKLLLVMNRPRAVGTLVQLRVQARDVSLSLSRPESTSILNILPVSILGMREDGPGQVMVSLQAGRPAHSAAQGGTRLLARLSRHSAQALQLQVGMQVGRQVQRQQLLQFLVLGVSVHVAAVGHGVGGGAGLGQGGHLGRGVGGHGGLPCIVVRAIAPALYIRVQYH